MSQKFGNSGYFGQGCEGEEVIESKSRHDWLEKVIHKELCTRQKFDLTGKLENETHKI